MVRLFFLPVVMAVWINPAAALPSPACQEDMVRIVKAFDEAIARLETAADADLGARCAAYRDHVGFLRAAREVFQRCLSGHDRTENVGALEVSMTDFRTVIATACNGR